MTLLAKVVLLSALAVIAVLVIFVVACNEDSPSVPYADNTSVDDVAAAARMAAEAVNRDADVPGQGIVVSGTGTASAEPDLALINLGVQVLSPSVGEALNTANTSLENILDSPRRPQRRRNRHPDPILQHQHSIRLQKRW